MNLSVSISFTIWRMCRCRSCSKRNDGCWGFLEHGLHIAGKAHEARTLAGQHAKWPRASLTTGEAQHDSIASPPLRKPQLRGIPHHWHQRHRALLDHHGCDSRCGEQGRDATIASSAAAGVHECQWAAGARTDAVLWLPANAQHDGGTVVGGGVRLVR
jgi:hypothetical protein